MAHDCRIRAARRNLALSILKRAGRFLLKAASAPASMNAKTVTVNASEPKLLHRVSSF
jgi:hypothetical protein